MFSIIIGLLAVTAAIGAPIVIHRGARSVSFGTPPGGAEVKSIIYREPIRANHDGRLFGPGIYELVLSAGLMGIVGRHTMRLPTSALMSYFYPAWWLEPGDVTVSSGKSNVLWRGTQLPAVLISYQSGGETHALEIVPPDLPALVEHLREAGFTT